MSEPGGSIYNKIIDYEKIAQVIDEYRLSKKTIALCHGVFDLLHPGHLRHLAKAKEIADVVLVSITADKYVNKGPNRPAFPENLRVEALASIVSVDFVVITPYETAVEIIELVKPNLYVKGNDYEDEARDVTGNISKEKKCVEQHGGKLVHTNEVVFSSSQLINQHYSNHSEEVLNWLTSIKSKYSNEEILSWIKQISSLKVSVIGETIIDSYTDCEVLGKSSKDPVLCLNKGHSKSYAGGILAIGANCHGLGSKTRIITGFNAKDKERPEIRAIKDMGIDLVSIDTAPFPTIEKERIVDSRTSTRILELYEMNDTAMSTKKNEQFVELVQDNIKDTDLVIIADYGHGLINNKVVQALDESKKYLSLNAQVNAGNRGLNTVLKYTRADFVTLNAFETQIEIRRRNISLNQFLEETKVLLKTSKILITKGSSGLTIYDAGGNEQHSPALAAHVKDRVGAGDAVLCITAMLSALNAPNEIIGFYGALVGAWAVSFTGNEKNLRKLDLVKYATAILK